MATDSLTVTDNRTGETYELPITNGTVKAIDLRQMKSNESDFGLMAYDPAFTNTVSCSSSVTHLDGEAGVLQYRGYPIEQLAEKSTFTEVAYLLIYGRLPSEAELDSWNAQLLELMAGEEVLKTITSDFPANAHPMGIVQATVAALGTLYPDSKDFDDDVASLEYAKRLIAQIAVLGSWAYRHGAGQPLLDAPKEASYPSAFLQMMFGEVPDPRIERALDILLILHADHEQNCSTSTVRVVGSSDADVHASVSSGIGALYGPLHGGANEAVLQMLARIGSKDNVPAFIEGVKNRDELLMGFGHRVYKNFDPRATIIKTAVDEVFEITGVNPLLEVAQELERIALEDEFFVGRKLYPNVDFYSGLLYEALGIPTDMFTVMFAIGRTPGWIAQWWEMKHDKEQKIARPRQVYTGDMDLDYVEISDR